MWIVKVNVQILTNLRLKSVSSRLVQINLKSYFVRINSTWGQLRSEELTPLDLKRRSRLGSTLWGRLPGLLATKVNTGKYSLAFATCQDGTSLSTGAPLTATSDIHQQLPTYMADICRDWLTNQNTDCCFVVIGLVGRQSQSSLVSQSANHGIYQPYMLAGRCFHLRQPVVPLSVRP